MHIITLFVFAGLMFYNKMIGTLLNGTLKHSNQIMCARTIMLGDVLDLTVLAGTIKCNVKCTNMVLTAEIVLSVH